MTLKELPKEKGYFCCVNRLREIKRNLLTMSCDRL